MVSQITGNSIVCSKVFSTNKATKAPYYWTFGRGNTGDRRIPLTLRQQCRKRYRSWRHHEWPCASAGFKYYRLDSAKHEAYIITFNVEQSRWYNILMIISTTSIDGLQKKLYAMICNHTCLLCVLLRFLSNYNVVCLVLTKEPRHCIYATLSLVGLGIYIYQGNNPFGDSGVSAHVQMILSHTARDIVTICLFIWP